MRPLIYLEDGMKKHNVFGIVYSKIRNKHPTWAHKQIVHCTVYALKNKG